MLFFISTVKFSAEPRKAGLKKEHISMDKNTFTRKIN